MAITLILLLPLLAILWIALTPAENLWPHLLQTALPRYFVNTIQLMALVAIGTAVIGTGTAWIVANYRFPGRDMLALGLLAPLAVPSFIAAYAFVDLLEYAGPVQTALRSAFAWDNARSYWFPEIRSIGGAATIMTFAFYPYTYLLARAAFHEQSASSVEAARALGCGPLRSLWRVCATARQTRHCGWHGPRTHGDAGGLRNRRILCGADPDGRHLCHMARGGSTPGVPRNSRWSFWPW